MLLLKIIKSLFVIILFLFLLSSNQIILADDTFITNAENYIVYDTVSDKVLQSNNPDETVNIGNLSVLMSIAVFLNEFENGNLKLDDTFRPNKDIKRSDIFPNLGLDKGMEVKHSTLLESVIVFSAIDSTKVLALLSKGSEEAFVSEMNKLAKEIGMENSLFHNSYFSKEDYSSPSDILKLSRYIYTEFPEYLPLFSKRAFEFDGNVYKNQNNFLVNNKNVHGFKSGWGQGFHLSALYKLGDRDFIIVNLDDSSTNIRDANAKDLTSFLESNYSLLEFSKKGKVYKEFFVYKSNTNGPEPVLFLNDLNVFVPKNVEVNNLNTSYDGTEYITGGTKSGDVLGKLKVFYNDDLLGEVEVGSSKDYPKSEISPSYIYDTLAILFNFTLMDLLSSILKR